MTAHGRVFGANSRLYLRRHVEQTGIDLAAIQNAMEKLPLVRRQIEQEGKPLPAERAIRRMPTRLTLTASNHTDQAHVIAGWVSIHQRFGQALRS